MNLAGGLLLVISGVWCGVLAAGRVSEAAARCEEWCRMLELVSFELTRFKTPLPALFRKLSDALDGLPGQVCASVSGDLGGCVSFRDAWDAALRDVPPGERELLLPLREILGCYGAGEQAAGVEAVRLRMAGLWEARRSALHDRRRVCVGLFSACGLVLAVLLI